MQSQNKYRMLPQLLDTVKTHIERKNSYFQTDLLSSPLSTVKMSIDDDFLFHFIIKGYSALLNNETTFATENYNLQTRTT